MKKSGITPTPDLTTDSAQPPPSSDSGSTATVAVTSAGKVIAPWIVLAIAGATQFILALDSTIMSVTLPTLQSELQLSDHDSSSVITYYAFFHGLLLLLGGRAVDAWGHHRTFLIGLVGFGCASLAGGLADSSTQLLAGRAIQGCFAALLAPTVFASISIIFTGAKERATAFLLTGVLAIGGAALGFVVGGFFTSFFSWRWCLLFNVPLCIIVCVVVVRVLLGSAETSRRRGFDPAGSLLSVAALSSLGLAGYLQREHSMKFYFWVCCAFFLLFSIAFVIVEKRVSAPLVPPTVLLDRTRSIAALCNAILVSNTLGGTLFLASYLQDILDFDAADTGLRVMPVMIGIILGGIAVTRLAGRFTLRVLIVLGALIAAAGMAILSRLTPEVSYWSEVFPTIAVLGFGLGVLSVCLPDLALVGAKPQEAGAASAVFTAYGQVGGAVGTTVLTLIYATAKSDSATLGELIGHAEVFRACAITLVCIAPIALVSVSTKATRRGAVPAMQRYLRIIRDVAVKFVRSLHF